MSDLRTACRATFVAALVCCCCAPRSTSRVVTADGSGLPSEVVSLPDGDVETVADAGEDRPGESPLVDPASSTDGRLCWRACNTTAEVVCPDRARDCVPMCLRAIASGGACTPLTRVVLACFIESGPGAWTCDPVGHATVLRPGYCEEEQAALADCILRPGGT